MSNMRILGVDTYVSNDSFSTHLNNNDLIIGQSGSGKTRSYVMPNILQMSESFICTDTKHRLYSEFKQTLTEHGYRVEHIDFTNLTESTIGYNPLDYIRFNEETNQPNEQDILRIARILSPIESYDPFWDNMAMLFITALIGYTFETLPEYERNLNKVSDLSTLMTGYKFETRIEELSFMNPTSFTARKYALAKALKPADKTFASVLGMLASKLDTLTIDETLQLYTMNNRVNFQEIGTSKFALFLSVSDTDRSLDKLISLIYTQAITELCRSADALPLGRLPHPVRLYLDDFACNCTISDFDNIIATIRSRNIAASIIVQDLPQLASKYTTNKARTIINNCDHILYLGSRDIQTISYIAKLADKRFEQIMQMPRDSAYLSETGKQAHLVKPYNIEQHPLYLELPEAFTWIDSLEPDMFELER